MRTVNDIEHLSGKTVLLRADLDVPVDENGQITEEYRVVKQVENLEFLLSKGARVVMVAHNTDPHAASFAELLPQLKRIFGREIAFLEDLKGVNSVEGGPGSLYLLDNVRRWPEEVSNDAAFASELANGFDVFVNNAFAVSHREHASVSAIAHMIPAYAGLLVEQEVQNLRRIVEAPADGKVIVMGGAKASTKVPVIDNLIEKAEYVLTGGVVAIDIMQAQGQDIGTSRVDTDIAQLLEGLDVHDTRLHVPGDMARDGTAIMDIGPQTAERYRAMISGASMVVWNGPMGVFEDERYSGGTRAVAEAIVNNDSFSLIGGGDTIAAVNQFGLLDRFGHVSTGGGAMLAFLAGEQLPGLVPLGVYE